MELGFLQGSHGPLFYICHLPQPSVPVRGAILYFHPLGEESNKSRHMVSLQARRLAACGYAVMLPDLHGCGDSGGDFHEARWDIWLEDMSCCLKWLSCKSSAPILLWGLRLGCLLAVDFLHRTKSDISGLALWHPMTQGRQMLTQFLRLRLAASLLEADKVGTDELRQSLRSGQSVEVAGYELSPELAGSLDSAILKAPVEQGVKVHWFDLVAQEDRPLSPITRKTVSEWQAKGVDVVAHAVAGTAFWATQEIAAAPALLDAMTVVYCKDETL